MVETKKSCLACAHCYVEPDCSYPICGHEDAGEVGLYVHHATSPNKVEGNQRIGHCGPGRSKFEQHPLRNPDGSLKDRDAPIREAELDSK